MILFSIIIFIPPDSQGLWVAYKLLKTLVKKKTNTKPTYIMKHR